MLLLAIAVIACVRKRNEPQAPNDTDLHNLLFREGTNLITPYMPLHGLSPKDAHSSQAQKEIKNGIAKLEQVLVLNPQNWAAFWIIGKGHQALENYQKAYESFKASWSIHKQNIDVAREYMIQCLNLGKSAEGVAIAEAALRLEPNEPGLVANYALALLIDGQMDRAENEVKRSL
jgi:tetratricopeptide (TPR) repeat protein